MRGAWQFFERRSRPAKIALAAAAGLLCFVAWQFAGATKDAIKALRTEATVGIIEGQATAARGAARDAGRAADGASVDRAVEDGVRGRVIAPELQRRRAASRAAHDRVKRAEENYAKAQSTHSRGRLDDDALRRRNCADLAELYPDERFEGCR